MQPEEFPAWLHHNAQRAQFFLRLRQYALHAVVGT